MFARVLQKIILDQAQCVLVLPKWTDRWFYKMAQHIAKRKFTFPIGTPLFELADMEVAGIKWPVEMVYVCAVHKLATEEKRLMMLELQQKFLQGPTRSAPPNHYK